MPQDRPEQLPADRPDVGRPGQTRPGGPHPDQELPGTPTRPGGPHPDQGLPETPTTRPNKPTTKPA